MKGLKFKLSPRIVGYSSILVILMVVLTTMLLTRSDIETTILRTPGILYQETDQGSIKNLYNIKIINKTFEKMPIELKLERPTGKIKMVGGDINIPESEIAETSFFVELEKKNLFTTSIPIQIGVYSNEQLLEEVNTNFMGPQKQRK